MLSGTNLMVGNQDHALREIAHEGTIFPLAQLAPDALVTTNSHLDGRPPVSHCGDQNAKLLLCHSHPRVKPILVVKVKRGAYDLGDGDTDAGC